MSRSVFWSLLIWLPFGFALTVLSHEGWKVAGLPDVVSWPLAAGCLMAGWEFMRRFAHAREWRERVLWGVMAALVVGLSGAANGMSFVHSIRQANTAPAAVAKASAESAHLAVANADAAVKDAEAGVVAAESAWNARRQDAETEKGRGGPGKRWEDLTKEAAGLGDAVTLARRELSLRREALTKALVTAAESKAQAVDLEQGQHILAFVPWWVLFVGSLVLEVAAAALGAAAHGGRAREADEARPGPAVGPQGAVPAVMYPVMAPAAPCSIPERVRALSVQLADEDHEQELEREFAREAKALQRRRLARQAARRGQGPTAV